jgi:hypothetical protein
VAEPPAARARDLGHEPRDVSVRWVVVAAFGGLLVVALSGAARYGLQRLYATADLTAAAPPPRALERRAPEPPPPRLQVDPAADLATHLARESAILGSYGWVDESAGIARIPIERAMELIAERGWPEPAEGPRPPPEVARGLNPSADWQGARPPTGSVDGGPAPEAGEVGR